MQRARVPFLLCTGAHIFIEAFGWCGIGCFERRNELEYEEEWMEKTAVFEVKLKVLLNVRA